MKTKRFLPVTLIIFPYLLIFPILLNILHIPVPVEWINENTAKILSYLFPALILLYLISQAVYILYAVFTKASPASLAFWNMVVKLCHIPFYIFIFIFGIGVMIAIPLLWLIDAILMFTSSSFGISAILRAKSQGHISTTFLVVNIFCHLIFVADVISAVVVYRKLRK